jgi:hypothetical protein
MRTSSTFAKARKFAKPNGSIDRGVNVMFTPGAKSHWRGSWSGVTGGLRLARPVEAEADTVPLLGPARALAR